MAKRILVTFEGNYADEFDVSAFKIFKKKELKEFEEEMRRKYEGPFELYFGTNECLEFDSVDDFFDQLGYEELTKEEAKIIEDKIGSSFGFTSILGY